MDDSIPALIPLTAANFDDPPVLKPKYIVIIDSGSSGSRLYIYGPEASQVDDIRLGVGRMFGPIASTTLVPDCGGGIQCAQNHQQMEAHLYSILGHANVLLENLGATRANTPIYLLATGGMRGLAADQNVYNNVLGLARAVIQGFPGRLFAYQQTNIRTITGQQEGWFAWIFQNYGIDRVGLGPKGSMEMGGASVQHAYAVPLPGDNVAPICYDPDNPILRQNVYSQTWDNRGTNSLNDALVVSLNNAVNCPNQRCRNPCLPRNMTITRNGVQTEGTGSFDECEAFAAARQLPILAPPGVPVLEAISGFYWTYRFPLFGLLPAQQQMYNAVLFRQRVQEFCGGDWDGGEPPEYTGTMCLNAAWMLVSFNNAGRPIFLTKSVAWTHGAAALILNHGGLKLCSDVDDLLEFDPNNPNLVGNFDASFVHVPQTLSLSAPAQLHAAPVMTPLVTLWTYSSFVLALMFIIHLLVQRYRTKAHSKIHLRDLENVPGVREKGHMQDLARTVLGSEGFYKD